MYGTPLYIKYERWREQQIERLQNQYDDDKITEDEYDEAIGNLNYEDFVEQYYEHNRD